MSSNSTSRYLSKENENTNCKDIYTPMFPATLFTTAKIWKQPNCPSTEKWIKKMWYRYTVDYSVQFSRSVMSDSLGPHGLQHARPPCPSSTPGVCSNSCPLSQWCCSTICSSVAPFSSCPQSFPASVFSNESSGGQNIGASASASVLPMNIQGCLHSVFFGQEAYRILAPWSVIEPANPALEG